MDSNHSPSELKGGPPSGEIGLGALTDVQRASFTSKILKITADLKKPVGHTNDQHLLFWKFISKSVI